LREITEDEFSLLFNTLKEKTNNWKNISPELLLENNQFFLIIRCALRLSQRELAEKLQTSKDYIRGLEAGKTLSKI